MSTARHGARAEHLVRPGHLDEMGLAFRVGKSKQNFQSQCCKARDEAFGLSKHLEFEMHLSPTRSHTGRSIYRHELPLKRDAKRITLMRGPTAIFGPPSHAGDSRERQSPAPLSR